MSSLNPYAPLPEVNDDGFLSVEFSGLVDLQDIRRGMRNTVGLIGCAILLAFLVSALFETVGQARWRLACFFFMPSLFFGSIGYLCLNRGNRFAAKFPTLLGQISGRLTTRRFEFEWNHGKSWTDIRMLRVLHLDRRGTLFSGGLQYYLPARVFDDFDAARKLARSIGRIGPVPALGSEELTRAISPEQLTYTTGNGISFVGPIFVQDFAGTPVGKAIQRARWAWVWLLLISGLVGLFVGSFTESIPIGGSIAGGLFLYLWFVSHLPVWRQQQQLADHTDGSPTVAYRVAGSVSDDWISAETAVGGGRYQWAAFDTYKPLDADRISLCLRGKVPHLVLLTRRQFQTDEDWSRALALIEKNVGTKLGKR